LTVNRIRSASWRRWASGSPGWAASSRSRPGRGIQSEGPRGGPSPGTVSAERLGRPPDEKAHQFWELQRLLREMQGKARLRR
jgi:hypothetical protein